MTNLKTYILLFLFFGLFACNSNLKTENNKKETVETKLNPQKGFSEIRKNLYMQSIMGKYWHINKIIGLDMQNTQEFILTKIDSTSKNDFIYGNKIIFNIDKTFICNYSASCGNDCFPSSTGTFKLIDENHINLFVIEFNQDGDCESKQVQLNVDIGTYYISKKSDKRIKLEKRN